MITNEMMDQQSVWDAIAESWYRHRQKPFPDVVPWLELISSMKPGKILDAGCGNCRNLLLFAKAGFDCYGIDFSRQMLDQAKKFCKKHSIHVKLKQADITNLPFSDNFFDYVLCIAVLHHLKKQQQLKALQELRRVLKPNGLLLITVWNKLRIRPLLKFLFKKQAYIKWKYKDKCYYRYYYFFSPIELFMLVRRAGFYVIKHNLFRFQKNLIVLARKC